MSKPAIKLTATAVVDQNSRITAFFNELPALVVQGDSDDDVKEKLGSLLQSFIKRLQSADNNFEIKTKVLA
jgi:hypothetical protein